MVHTRDFHCHQDKLWLLSRISSYLLLQGSVCIRALSPLILPYDFSVAENRSNNMHRDLFPNSSIHHFQVVH